jgi:hypothetical protein
MDGPDDLATKVRRLEARVDHLESLYGLIDLLALPGLLAGGAMRIFDCTQTAETVSAQATGFYGRELAGGGLAIRWTQFPQPALLDIAVIAAIPFAIQLQVLNTPHIQNPADLDVTLPDGARLAFELNRRLENGVIEFVAAVTAPTTGVLRLALSSTSHLQGSGGDTRKLGLPFVQLRSRPRLSMTPGG